eukprot:scaffold359_cov351-Pinguiococcus_pyrenoidosus.AAC.1
MTYSQSAIFFSIPMVISDVAPLSKLSEAPKSKSARACFARLVSFTSCGLPLSAEELCVA